MNNDFKKLDNENFHQYIWRIDGLIQSGKYKNWREITIFVNRELFGDDESQYRDESAYRKAVKYARDFYEANVFCNDNNDEYIKELQLQKQELFKEKVKARDEQNELRRTLREQARKESYIDMIERIIGDKVDPIILNVNYNCFNTDTDLLCSLTDIHSGIKIDNWKNKFNENILKDRIEKYTSEIINIRNIHNSQDCYIVISEILSGIIHNNLRLQNNMNLIEQFKYISELIAVMLVELSYNFNHIYVYTTQGNHSRISPKKEDSIEGENMDLLLPFYLKAKLQNIKNISICDNEIESEIAIFDIRGNNIFSSHGDKDSPNTVVQNFTMMFGIKPDIVLLGHRHKNGLTTIYDTKVIESGSVSGADNFAVSIRKVNKPEQAVSVIGEKGLICLYDIQLDD